MFVLNEILNFGVGRRQEGWDRLAWIHSTMAPHDGFIEAIVAKYLGEGHRHTIMRFWRDEDAYQAFRSSPDGGFGSSRPQGLYTNEPVLTPLLSYGEYSAPMSGNFLVNVQADIAPDAWDAFLAHQKVMMANAPDVPGLVWDRQMRAKEKDAIVGTARLRSREDFEDLLESPAYGQLLRDMPAGVTLVRVECFEVISDVGPKK